MDELYKKGTTHKGSKNSWLILQPEVKKRSCQKRQEPPIESSLIVCDYLIKKCWAYCCDNNDINVKRNAVLQTLTAYNSVMHL